MAIHPFCGGRNSAEWVSGVWTQRGSLELLTAWVKWASTIGGNARGAIGFNYTLTFALKLRKIMENLIPCNWTARHSSFCYIGPKLRTVLTGLWYRCQATHTAPRSVKVPNCRSFIWFAKTRISKFRVCACCRHTKGHCGNAKTYRLHHFQVPDVGAGNMVGIFRQGVNEQHTK